MAKRNAPELREPSRDCINYVPSSMTAYGSCIGVKELSCVIDLEECPFYKSNKEYYSDGRPRRE